LIDVEEVLKELFKSIGISCEHAKLNAISGSVQQTRTIEIHTLVSMIRCLNDYEFFAIELEKPIITSNDVRPFKINSITFLIKKVGDKLRIEKIYSDEEEIFKKEGWVERAHARLVQWAPIIDLILLLCRIASALTPSSAGGSSA
jgi:hypothetical protein